MAVNNRAEALTEVDSALVPTLTLAQHKALLKDEILNSVVFDKDVIATESPVAGAVTINYLNKDIATVITAVNLAVSFTNLENGAVKYLEITKNANNVISFVGANDMVNFRDQINTLETVVVYRISNKNGNVYVEALFAPDSSAWNSLTLSGSWTGSVKYRLNNFTGKIEMFFNINTTSSSDNNIGILSSPYWPSVFHNFLLPIGGILAGGNDTGGDPIIGARLLISSVNGQISIVTPNPLILNLGSFGVYGYTEYFKTAP